MMVSNNEIEAILARQSEIATRIREADIARANNMLQKMLAQCTEIRVARVETGSIVSVS